MSGKSEIVNKILKPVLANFIKTTVKEQPSASVKLVNKAKLASNGLKRFLTGEAAAEKQLNKLAKQRIL